jgi:hypothetical protein
MERTTNNAAVILEDGMQRSLRRFWKFKNNAVDEDRGFQFG